MSFELLRGLQKKGILLACLVFGSGFLFCILMVTLPELWPALHGKPGSVWSPVHSQNYRFGDLYYYGAWLKEVLETGIPAYSPTAAELNGQPLVETWRFFALILAALPGLLIDDIRMIIVFDYGLSAALFFSIGFFFAYTHTRNSLIGIVTGIFVLFLTDNLWASVRPFASISEIWRLPASAGRAALDYFRYASNFIEYDIYGSTFRFINVSLSGPILLLFFFIATLAYKDSGLKSSSALVLISPLMAFSYPSHTIIAYGLMITFCAMAVFRRNWKTVTLLFAVGMMTILFLEIIQYRKLLSELFSSSELWNGIFASEKLELLNNDTGFIFSVLFLNKYLITFLLMIYLTRKKPVLLDVVIATGLIASALSSVYLFNMPQLWGRFLGRGIDHIWFMLLIVVLGDSIADMVSTSGKVEGGVLTKTFKKGCLFSACAIVLAMFTAISVGFLNMARHTSSNGSRFLSSETMNAYQWISNHIPPNAEIASLDWEDITLLPIFTNANLVVGHSLIGGRSPFDEINRFAAAWKYFGYSRQELEQLLDIAPEACLQMRKPFSYMHPPRLPSKRFEAAQFMEGIIYWPYIKKVSGINITDKNDTKLSPEFKQFILRIFDNSRQDEFLKQYKVKYITMSTEQALSLGAPKGMRLLYKTGTRYIFGLG